jgi:hypothetical protein
MSSLVYSRFPEDSRNDPPSRSISVIDIQMRLKCYATSYVGKHTTVSGLFPHRLLRETF